MRSRPPTDQQRTGVYDPDRPADRATKKGLGLERSTPTEVTPPPVTPPAKDQSQPIRVISLKSPGDGATDSSEERQPVKVHQPRIRSLSEVSPQRNRVATPPGGLGYLAPPRDPRQARTRRLRDYVLWGSVVVMLAGVVMLGVWFLAGM